jgi:outer membrane protein OmpA-like peptidoglycan-associated protein
MNLFYRFFSLSFLFITACANQPTVSLPVSVSAIEQQQHRIDELQKSGVQVIQLGDELRLILPDQHFFIKNTATLKVSSYKALNEIVILLNQKKNYGIHVLAYTRSLADLKLDISLAQQQAQAIVDYLMQQGLKTRLIVADAWKGVSDRQRLGTGNFNDDGPRLFAVEIRTRLLQPEDSQ